MIVQPLAIRLPAGQSLLDLFIGDDAAFHGIDQKHLPRLKPAFGFDSFGRDLEHARFRSHHYQAIVRNDVSAGPQSISVEGCAHNPAVGKCNRRRTIPRLHQRCVIFVESALFRLHVGIARPCFGDQHCHQVCPARGSVGLPELAVGAVERAEVDEVAGTEQILGIAATRCDRRINLLQVIAE